MAASSDQHYRTPRYGEANMVAAIIRLEQHVSFNHQNIQRINKTVSKLQHTMEGAVASVTRMRDDVRLGRFLPQAIDQGLCGPSDIEVLANQLAAITTKINRVDNLETELQLTKQRLKRLETQIATDATGPLLSGAASGVEQRHDEAMRAQQKQQAPSHPVPTMRADASEHFEHGHPSAPVLESQSQPGCPSRQKRHIGASEQENQASGQPDFCTVQLHHPSPPPPPDLCRWRPAQSYPYLRSQPLKSEPQAGGWADIDLSQASKRALDEFQCQYDSDQHGSPKRPKLATLPSLKPGSSFGNDYHQYPDALQAQINPARQAHAHVLSGENPIRPHTHPALGQKATNLHRFETSTEQPEQKDLGAMNDGPAISVLSDRGTTCATRLGRGHDCGDEHRQSRGCGGRCSSGPTYISPPASEAPMQEHVHERVLSRWREHRLAAAQQATTNEHYPGPYAYSQINATRPSTTDPSTQTKMPSPSRPYSFGQGQESDATPIASNLHRHSVIDDLNPVNLSRIGCLQRH